jgi:hypothetical protein
VAADRQSFLHKVFTACADELGRLDQRMRDLLDEADPLTVDELLPEQEAELALPSDGTLAERRARVVARLVARQRYRPADFQTSLSPLLGLAAADIKVLERTHAMASSMRDDREIFEFFVYRDPTLPGTYYLTSAQALVDTIAASHTQGYVIESIDACCDDDLSHCDARPRGGLMAVSSAVQLADLALTWSEKTGDADLSLIDSDLASDRGLETAVILSLFLDRRAEDDDQSRRAATRTIAAAGGRISSPTSPAIESARGCGCSTARSEPTKPCCARRSTCSRRSPGCSSIVSSRASTSPSRPPRTHF